MQTDIAQHSNSRNYTLNKYRFVQAMRLFSLQVAFVCVLFGVALASNVVQINYFLCFLVFLATFLMQIGVNLINDFGDKNKIDERFSSSSLEVRENIKQSIEFNFYAGIGTILLSIFIGIYLASTSGFWIIWIGLVGVLSVIGYAQAPLDLKNRGLGLFAVFLSSGVLVVLGCFYILTQQLSFAVVLASLPISILTSLILLSNELRDFETDKLENQKTLTVRIGYEKGVFLYKLLALTPFLISLVLYYFGILKNIFFILPALFFVPILFKNLHLNIKDRPKLTKLTAAYFGIFGIFQSIGMFFAN